MEKHLIDEAVSTLDLQGSNVKESTVEDKDLQASVSASDTQQPSSEADKGTPVQVNGNDTTSPNKGETGMETDKENTNEPTRDPQVYGEAKDGHAKKTKSKEKNRLTIGDIVALSFLINRGYSFGKLKINRARNQTALKKKIASIKSYGVISPCLVVTARDCLEAGLEIIRFDGKTITWDTPNLDRILIVIDGEHRHVAVQQINSSLKNSEEKKECYYYLPIVNTVPILELLRQSNVVTRPWGGSDFLTSLIMSNEEAAKNEMLLWVQSKLEKLGDTATWEWVKLNKLGIPSRTKLIKAAGTDEKAETTYKEISDSSKFERGKSIYDAFARTFAESILGCKFFPEWVIGKLDELDYMSGPEAAKKIIEFASRLTRSDADKVEKIKGADRAQNVRNALDALYNERMK